MKKISILVNAQHTIEGLNQTIESLINQSSALWEVIIFSELIIDISQLNLSIEHHEKIRIEVINKPHLFSLKHMLSYVKTDIAGLISTGDILFVDAISKILKIYGYQCESLFVYANYYSISADGSKTLGDAKPLDAWEDALFVNKISGFLTFSLSLIQKLDNLSDLVEEAEILDFIYKAEEVANFKMVNEPLLIMHANVKQIPKEARKLVRQNAFKRRGLPNLDNFFIKIIKLDHRKLRKKRYFKKKQPINPMVGIENLVSAKNILDSHGMRNWLTDGTLLGFHRDGGFIKHDDDLDMGAFIEEFDSKIIMEFINQGWQVERFFGRQDIGLEIALKRNNLRLDIFFFYKENDELWHACWLKTKRGLNLIKYVFPHFETIESEFLGHKFNIPKNTEEYLATKYGSDWRIPTKKWHWAFDPPNSVRTDFYLNI